MIQSGPMTSRLLLSSTTMQGRTVDCFRRSPVIPEALLAVCTIIPPVVFAVNVMAPYVITGRLLGLIARAPDGGRVVNVASLSAASSVDFDNLQVRMSNGERTENPPPTHDT